MASDSCASCGRAFVLEARYCAHCGVPVDKPEGRSVDAWLDDLVSHDGAARAEALRTLDAMGPKADSAVARLAASLQHPDPAGLAAEALLQLGRHVEVAVRHILAGLTGADSPDVRLTHFGSLMKCGLRAAPAVPALRDILREALRGRAAHTDVAPNAARALGWIGPAAADALYELIDALQHSDPKVREAGAWSLGRLAGKGLNAVDALERAARDAMPAVAKEARKSLSLIRTR